MKDIQTKKDQINDLNNKFCLNDKEREIEILERKLSDIIKSKDFLDVQSEMQLKLKIYNDQLKTVDIDFYEKYFTDENYDIRGVLSRKFEDLINNDLPKIIKCINAEL